MKIAVVQRVLTDYRAHLFSELARSPDVELSVFSGEPNADEAIATVDSIDGVDVQLGRNTSVITPLGSFTWQRGITEWMASRQPDVLILPVSPRLVSTWQLRRVAKRTHIPVIGWGRGLEPYRKGRTMINAVSSRATKLLISQFDRLVVYGSKAAADYVRLGFEVTNIFIAHNAVQTATADRLVEEEAEARRGDQFRDAHGISRDVPLLVTVGRMIKQKRLDLLLNVAAGLRNDYHLVVVGRGPGEDEYRAQCDRLGIHVTFTGWLSSEELGAALLAADVGVLPGQGGLAINEMMAYGLPIICSVGDGTEIDLVRTGLNGYVVAGGHWDQMRDVLDRLLSDSALRCRFGNESRRIISEEVNLKTMSAQVHRAILSAVSPA